MELTKYLAELQKYFQALPQRDQLALKFLGGFLGVCLIVFAIVLPAKDFHALAMDQFSQERQLLSWLQAQSSLIESAARAPKPASQGNDRSLLTSITESAKKHDLSVKRIQPDGEKQLRVWMEQVPFDKVVVWLEEIVLQQRVSLNEVTIERQEAVPGTVNLRASIGF